MKANKKIKNLILDFGGVVLPIDFQSTQNAFKALGADTQKLNNISQFLQNPLFHLYETGKISSAHFKIALKEMFGIVHVSDEIFEPAWNAMLLDLPHENILALEQLKKHYHLFLLSNTNELHTQYIFDDIYKKNKIKLVGYFEKVYFSFQVKYAKPHPKIYQTIIDENKLNLEETLFIDDNLDNIQGAQRVNLQARLFPHNAPLNEIAKILSEIE